MVKCYVFFEVRTKFLNSTTFGPTSNGYRLYYGSKRKAKVFLVVHILFNDTKLDSASFIKFGSTDVDRVRLQWLREVTVLK
jgi:hypothetical protein